MGKIGFGYGSEWHLLRHLGYHREYLSQKVLEQTGGNSVEWLDFGFTKESHLLLDDKELLGLDFIKDESIQEKWRLFWPQSGSAQNWDAVGKVHFDGYTEWLLVEAKAHLAETKSDCGAKSPKSIEMIYKALEVASQAFGNTSVPVENWMKKYYQYANRLAVLNFLEKELFQATSARLLFIYFYGDHRDDALAPNSHNEWLPAIKETHDWLGIDENCSLAKKVHHLILPINPNNNT